MSAQGKKWWKGFQKVKKEFNEELLQVRRVTKVTSGGRSLRFSAAVAIGDKKGRVGLGVGKAAEVVGAIEKAVNTAKKSIITVELNMSSNNIAELFISNNGIFL